MKPALHRFAYCLDFLREQVADVAAPDMVAQPNEVMNHPARVIGHLTYACQLLGGGHKRLWVQPSNGTVADEAKDKQSN